MNVNGPENEKDTDSINRNPAVWQSSGDAYGFLRVMATPNAEIFQVFAGQGLGTLPDYYKIIKAATIGEAIAFIQKCDKDIHDEIMAG
jgi:hypothetical protein